MLALTLASAVTVGLVVARILYTGHIRYAFLIWNLFLAWLPLLFAFLACDHYHAQQSGAPAKWRFGALALAWLIFFPNAPYIFTDVVHLTGGLRAHFWADLVLILSTAITGLVLGFVSLFLMQTVIARMAGWFVSWIFIAAVAGLSGIGIYLGRFLRFNSWDVLVQPMTLVSSVGEWMSARPVSFAFPLLFATFLFISYVMLYALTHLRPAGMRTDEHGFWTAERPA
jgi:uncharacterized membrane protein